MRRFILGWEQRGLAPRFCAEIVSYADDFCVLGKAPAADMLPSVVHLMERLKLPINAQKTRCLRCPAEPMEFLGYRFGWNYRPDGGGAYIGTRPSKASIRSICRKISEQTGAMVCGSGASRREAEPDAIRCSPVFSAWPGQPGVLRGRCSGSKRCYNGRKHKVRSACAFPTNGCGILRPASPCADDQEPSVGEGMISSESRMPRHVRFDERGPGNAVMGAGLRAKRWNSHRTLQPPIYSLEYSI